MTVPLSLLESTVRAATLVATGPCTAAAISASVASLTEGVLKTMFIAKLKGIALAIGVMTAVVSGAVVLGQAGSDDTGSRGGSPTTKPARGNAAVDQGPATTAPGSENRSSQDDRTAALEEKLDRLVKVLERTVSWAYRKRQADHDDSTRVADPGQEGTDATGALRRQDLHS